MEDNALILVVVKQCLMNISDTHDSDEFLSDAEDDMMLFWGRRSMRLRQPTVHINYAEDIVPTMNDKEFSSHFRMTRDTFAVRTTDECSYW